jgi:hypothetical protein
MKYNICTVRPSGYVHSHAFDELESLIAAGISDLGFSVSRHANQLDPNAKNIIIGCHLLTPQSLDIVPRDSVIINTEQLSDEIGLWNQNLIFWLRHFEAWDYNYKNIEYISGAGLKRPKFLRLGYHECLESICSDFAPDIDVLFYGSINSRRRKILEDLLKLGVNLKVLYGVYGKDRDHWVSRSKIVLNIHCYKTHILEVVRCFYLMINKKAVVCEVNDTTVVDPAFQGSITGAPYDEIVNTCIKLLSNDNLRKRSEEEAYKNIKRLHQKNIMKELLLT